MKVSRDFRFEAAHNLPSYRGKPEPLHGHSWKLRVTVEAPVGKEGMAFDFVELGNEVESKVVSRLDHAYVNDVVDPPTAEGIAMWAWELLSHLPLAEITVWETENARVTYDGNQ